MFGIPLGSGDGLIYTLYSLDYNRITWLDCSNIDQTVIKIKDESILVARKKNCFPNLYRFLCGSSGNMRQLKILFTNLKENDKKGDYIINTVHGVAGSPFWYWKSWSPKTTNEPISRELLWIMGKVRRRRKSCQFLKFP